MKYAYWIVFLSLALQASPTPVDDDELAPERCSWSLLSWVGQLLPGKTPIKSKKKRKAIPLSERIVVTSPATSKTYVSPTTNPKASAPSQNAELPKLVAQAESLTREGSHIRDYVNSAWISSLRRDYAVASLLWGSVQEKILVSSREEFQAFDSVLKGLVQDHWIIVYDGDSKMAPYIRTLAGVQGIGIYGGEAPTGTQDKLFSISNPYLRLETFKAVDIVVTDNNSLMGLALQFSDKGVRYLVDPTDKGRLSIRRWETNLGFRSLGLKCEAPPKVIKSFGGIDLPAHRRWRGEPLELSIEAVLKGLTSFDRKQIESRTQILLKGETRLSELPGGMVLFGSSQNESMYTDLVYQSSRRVASRGIPIVTGGSGGFMSVANAGAWDAGGHSVGIPLTGGFRLKMETGVAVEHQTLTVDSSEYSTRIPLLLKDRSIVAVAPGGSGTMREVATLLVQLSAMKREEIPHIVFLSSDYYGELYEGLQQYAPRFLIEKIHLVSNDADWEPILDSIESEMNVRGQTWRTMNLPVPRNERTHYKPPATFEWKKQKKDSDWWW